MISKVMTLSRPRILEEMFSIECDYRKQTSKGASEFFDIGSPLIDPISPTGSIVAYFERSFLSRNERSFLWGSIPDNGGVKSGFMPHLPPEIYKSLRLCYRDFTQILDQIDALPPDTARAVLYKQKSEDFCTSLQNLIDNRVIAGLLEQPMHTARRIEFCLKGNIRVSDVDVISIYIPNTYKRILSERSARVSKSKINYYNPRRPTSWQL